MVSKDDIRPQNHRPAKGFRGPMLLFLFSGLAGLLFRSNHRVYILVERYRGANNDSTAVEVGRRIKHMSDDQSDATTNLDRPLPCKLRSSPAPMILMSLGRSGTSSMYQVMSTLASDGDANHKIVEYTGSGTSKSNKFFEGIPSSDVSGDWLVKYICREQRRNRNAGIVGFKWKPFENIFTSEKAMQGLELLARLKDPQIKVVRSRRNLLDVMISR